jgi:hypothetical protein
MCSNGQAFIKFIKGKKLILWRDNNLEKRNKKTEEFEQMYDLFFMQAAILDIFAECV